MEIEQNLSEIKQQFDDVIKYTQNIPDPQTDRLFEIWRECKRDFIEVFKTQIKNNNEYLMLMIAEIGINHNGNLDNALKLIDVAKHNNCDIVKFQKRNPDLCVPEDQKNKEKIFMGQKMTYLEYKKKLEFSIKVGIFSEIKTVASIQ